MPLKTTPPAAASGKKLSTKGLSTRQRIVQTAAKLMLTLGVEATTIEMVQNEARVSASQLYHYFIDKHDIMLAVLDLQTESVLSMQRQSLRTVENVADLHSWRDLMVSTQKQLRCVGGCPIGSLSSQVAKTDQIARQAIVQAMQCWEDTLRSGLETMRSKGILRADAPTERLATTLLATVQGGLLLTDIQTDTRTLEIALDTVIEHIKSYELIRK